MVKHVIVAFALLTFFTSANTDNRKWVLKSGSTLQAELVSFDEETQIVTLLENDRDEKQLPFDSFREVDKAWLLEWLNISDEINNMAESLGGSLEHHRVSAQFETDLYVYHPALAEGTVEEDRPVMILFNAGAKALRYMKRHLESAEESDMLLICCGQFRNTGDDIEKESAFLERFREVFPAICNHFRFNKDLVFMGGNSGGAWRAYHYSAWIEYPWAGIYANGGWLGGEKYFEEDYADGMKVAMVNGNVDHAANHWVEQDSAILQQHQADIAIISFEGGHQVPPTKTITKAFRWLIDESKKTSEVK